MDKRIGWNFDNSQHATFNPLRPIPVPRSSPLLWQPVSKTNSRLGRSRARFLDENRIIGSPAINMRIFRRRFVLRAGVVALILIFLWAIAIGPEPPARVAISPEELVRAVTVQRDSLVDLCLMERVDPNGRDGQGRTPLLIATSQQDWKTARRLLDAGAAVDLRRQKWIYADNGGSDAWRLGNVPAPPGPLNQSSAGKTLRRRARPSELFPRRWPAGDHQDCGTTFADDAGLDEQHAARFVQSVASRGRTTKSGCCLANTRRHPYPKAKQCRFWRMQLRAATSLCLTRS